MTDDSDPSGSEPATQPGFDPAAYDAVIYDLDGTLVRLSVDWGAVADDVLDAYASQGIVPPTDDLWSLFAIAADYGLAETVEATIASHERAGAEASTRLPLAGILTTDGAQRTAVCSLNCEEACRIALGTHDLSDGVSAVVGRDTVEGHKPDPGPLLSAVDALGVDPEHALFVGDSERDAVTARRAGVPFRYVSDVLE